MTTEQMLEQERENQKNVSATCSYIRDESVNGQAAVVYSEHSQTEDMKTDGQVWISRSKGLIVRQELDTDVGGTLGKTHRSIRYEYDNVRPPVE